MEGSDAREVAARPSAEPLARRSSVAQGASHQRQSRASRCQKSWIQDEQQVDITAVEDAAQAGVQEMEARRIVKYVTRFATSMCVARQKFWRRPDEHLTCLSSIP
eukprot:Skav220267  [mRNA]  locus=scaffold3532:27387:29397:- [translate_table: standard]